MKIFLAIIVGLCLIPFLFYVSFMVMFPLYEGGWVYTLKVWKNWQTFNAGMIALLAAIITACTAIYIDREARKRDNLKRSDERTRIAEQRNREFIAARAFLPHALAIIDTYAKNCATSIRSIYIGDRFKTSPTSEQRELLSKEFQNYTKPSEFEKVFQECIRLGGDEDSRQVVKLLTDLQIFISRMSEFERDVEIPNSYIIEMLVYSVYFQFKVAGFYDFARKGSAITNPSTDPESYYTRLSTLGHDYEAISSGCCSLLDRKISLYAKDVTSKDRFG